MYHGTFITVTTPNKANMSEWDFLQLKKTQISKTIFKNDFKLFLKMTLNDYEYNMTINYSGSQ